MPYILPTTLLITLLTSSLPCLYHYTTASSNLLTYESATKKAAKYVTSEASRQLHKSRTTMATALLSTVTSLAASSLLLKDLFYPTDTSESRVYWHVELATLSVLVGGVADWYVGGFWKGAMKATGVPGMLGYNDAVRSTESGLWWSRNVMVGWLVYVVYALTFQVQT